MSVSPTVQLSPSRVEGACRCVRKHQLAEVLGQQPNDREAAALEFGDRMHQAAGKYWRLLQTGLHPSEGAWRFGADVLRDFSWPLNEKHTLQLALSMWAAYQQARPMPFGGDEWELETVEVRRDIRLPSCTLSFQIDRLLRNKLTGARALVDLKTASRCDTRWANQWRRSLQMKLYAAAIERSTGEPLQWLAIEGLAKDKPAITYVALPTFSQEVCDEAIRVVEYVASVDAAALNRARRADGSIDVELLTQDVLVNAPFNPAECYSYNHPCDYLPLCEAEPSERIALLRADYHYEQPKHLV